MSFTASIPIRPFTRFSHSRLRNPIKISTFTLDFPPPKSAHWNSTTRSPNSMNAGAIAARMDDDDVDVRFSSLEQEEALINASKLVGASVSGLEAVLNKLVGEFIVFFVSKFCDFFCVWIASKLLVLIALSRLYAFVVVLARLRIVDLVRVNSYVAVW